jgi:hypothetical protein
MLVQVRHLACLSLMLAGCSLDDLTAGSPDAATDGTGACADVGADFCTEFDGALPGPWDEVRGSPTIDDGVLVGALPAGSPDCSYSDVVKDFTAAQSFHLLVSLWLETSDARVVRVSQSSCTHMLYALPDGLRLHTQAAVDTIDQTGLLIETGRWHVLLLDLEPDGSGTRVSLVLDGSSPFQITRPECAWDGLAELSLGVFCDIGPDEVRFDWARVGLGP